jgi:hypothetical protein
MRLMFRRWLWHGKGVSGVVDAISLIRKLHISNAAIPNAENQWSCGFEAADFEGVF